MISRISAACLSALLSIEFTRAARLTCNERDILAITIADDSTFASCFLSDDWSWKLSFEECLVSNLKIHDLCAASIRESAYPSFISPNTCSVGECDVQYAMQRAVSTVASPYTGLGPGECSSSDLALLSAVRNSANGSLPSAAPANLSTTCTSCLAQATGCPSAQPTDVCYPSNPSAACFGCQQMNAAKQMSICAVAAGTNPHAYDCSDSDIDRLTNFRLDDAVECFSGIIGWQGAVQFCLVRRGVNPVCAAYVSSQVFFTDSDQACVSGIAPTDEVSTNPCLISMWRRGVASVLNTSIEISNLNRTQTCTDADVSKLTNVTNNTILTSVVGTLSTACQNCVGVDPIAVVQANCDIYCNSTVAEFRNLTWGCSACIQFESAKILTNCTVGESKFSSVNFGYSGLVALAIGIVALLI